jgi:hypothetical protein
MKIPTLLSSALLSIVVLLVSACGGGGSGGGSSTVSGATTGTVAIAMTDGPAEEFDEILVTVLKIELLSEQGRVTVYEGEKVFNLLELADESRLFAIRKGVPAGVYNKIRLTLKRIELIKKDDRGNVVESEEPKLPGNGKLDLVPRGEFRVLPQATLVVEIDMDANKSIHVHETGSGKYQFRPVVFVDVITEALFGKLVRLHGVIEDIDPEDREFKLCETDVPVRLKDDEEDHQTRGCVQVDVVRGTSVFDENGQPVLSFRDLVEGEEATVYGRFRRDNETEDREDGIDSASHDDRDHDWDDDDRDDDRDDDWDDDKDGDRPHHEIDDLELVAEVIQLGPEGTYQQLDGVAESTVDSDDQFIMSIDPDQGFVADSEVSVQIQPRAKIINRRGEELDQDAIVPGVPMRVDGVLDIAVEPDILFAVLIVLDTDADRLDKLSGVLGANPDGSCGFNLVTGAGDRSIRYDSLTRAYVVSDSGSTQVDVEDLPPGLQADVYGEQADDGCFDAENVIAFD